MPSKPPSLVVRDSRSFLSNDQTRYRIESSSMDIIGRDGRTAFSIRLIDAATIEVRVSDNTIKDESGVILDYSFVVVPVAYNSIQIRRNIYAK